MEFEHRPSVGFIAWLLWGRDAGKAWADGKAAKLEKEQGGRGRRGMRSVS